MNAPSGAAFGILLSPRAAKERHSLLRLRKHSGREHDREGHEFYSCRKPRKINSALASEVRSSWELAQVFLAVTTTTKRGAAGFVVGFTGRNLGQPPRKDDPNRIVFYEIYRSQAAQDLHLQQDFTKKFLTTLKSAQVGDRVRTNLVELAPEGQAHSK